MRGAGCEGNNFPPIAKATPAITLPSKWDLQILFHLCQSCGVAFISLFEETLVQFVEVSHYPRLGVLVHCEVFIVQNLGRSTANL